jgi:Rps23 Pro-64 3,4-dihydroxylase Tpa1-like proline 4-hydroxylase
MINTELSNLFKNNYQSAFPFPHIVIDNFIQEDIANEVAEEVKKYKMWGYDPSAYSVKHQVNKFFSPWCDENLNDIQQTAPKTWNVLSYLNSKEATSFLETLTGISDILPDNKFVGGGMHKINAGGRLAVHADYNVHPENGLHRRINLLLYLNKDWKSEWGGNLELWEKDMSKVTHSIEPVFNRAVIFNITDDAFHGHPHPLTCPEDVSRYSLALYYFTETRPENEISEKHAAIWQEHDHSVRNYAKF